MDSLLQNLVLLSILEEEAQVINQKTIQNLVVIIPIIFNSKKLKILSHPCFDDIPNLT
jgi:hypothetical protein